MERLTQKVGILETIDKARNDIRFLKQVVLKLADYEDTNLTPQEAKELLEQNQYLLERLEKYEWKYGSADTAMFYAELQQR